MKPYIQAGVIFIGIVLIVLIGGSIWAWMALDNTVEEEKRIQELTGTTTPSPTTNIPSPDAPESLSAPGIIKEVATVPNGTVYEFSSTELGIRFQYVSTNEQAVTVLQQRNTVCLTFNEEDITCDEGQSVEVFTKESNDTLASALEEQVIKDSSDTQCFVEPLPTTEIRALPDFRYVHISYPEGNPPDDGICPAEYRRTNGLRYFALHTDYPNRFFSLISVSFLSLLAVTISRGRTHLKYYLPTYNNNQMS